MKGSIQVHLRHRLCSAVSFYGNKTITTGEGGAFFTNDLATYKFMKTYFSHGMSDKRYVHNILGTNYRMTNIQAAFLYDQLNDIENILTMKKKIIDNYRRLLEELGPRVFYLKSDPQTEESNWMFVTFIRDIVYEYLEAYMLEKNIQIRPLFYDIHEHEHLRTIKKMITDDSIEEIRRIGFMLPSYPELSLDEQKYIVNCIKEYLVISSK